MRNTLSTLSVLAVLAAAPALAQDTAAPPEGQSGDAGASGLSMGEPVGADPSRPGAPYVKEEHGDWVIRCIRTESGADPCQLYQLLSDDEGNAVAEFAIFPLMPPQGEAVAGGNVITPLETLLTQQVTLQIDGGEPRRYPFSFCTQVGCFARVGYVATDVDRLKKGSKATVTIVPVVAPDQQIALTVSLSGFTAAFDALTAYMQAQVEAAGAAAGGAEGGAAEGGTEGGATSSGN